jgi:hypothetical protein
MFTRLVLEAPGAHEVLPENIELRNIISLIKDRTDISDCLQERKAKVNKIKIKS